LVHIHSSGSCHPIAGSTRMAHGRARFVCLETSPPPIQVRRLRLPAGATPASGSPLPHPRGCALSEAAKWARGNWEGNARKKRPDPQLAEAGRGPTASCSYGRRGPSALPGGVLGDLACQCENSHCLAGSDAATL
jgi:hypothetical protein